MSQQGFGRHYISADGIEDIEHSTATMYAIADRLQQLMRDNFVSGYIVRALYDEDTILDERLEPEEILLFSEGRLPVVFVSLAYGLNQKDNKEPLEQLEKDFQLRLFKAFSISDRT